MKVDIVIDERERTRTTWCTHSFKPLRTRPLRIYLRPLRYRLATQIGYRPGWQISGEEIVGVTLTRDEWVSDLWVRRDSRRLGIGGKLLAQAELEISSRGHEPFHLRVVKSNARAVQFYQSQGWRVHREFPHEKFGHAMFEMTKILRPKGSG